MSGKRPAAEKKSFGILDLPPISPQLSLFLIAQPPHTTKAANFLNQMQQYLKKIKTLHEHLIDTMNTETNIVTDHRLEKKLKNVYLLPHIAWARAKYKSTCAKYHRKKQYNDAVLSKLVTQLYLFLEQSVLLEAPFSFDYDGFYDKYFKHEDPELRRLKFKIDSLLSYVRNNAKVSRIPDVRDRRLLRSLKKAAEQVNEKDHWVPMTEFDNDFYWYLVRTDLITHFDELLESMPVPQGHVAEPVEEEEEDQEALKCSWEDRFNSPCTREIMNKLGSFRRRMTDVPVHDCMLDDSGIVDPVMPFDELCKTERATFENFDMFVNFFFTTVAGSQAPQQEYVVIRCACIRFLFDLYYAKYPMVLTSEPASKSFVEKCVKITRLSPKSLKMSEKAVSPDKYIKSMKTIIEQNEPFKNACRSVLATQFAVNPLDIAAEMNECIRNVQNGVEHVKTSRYKTQDMSFDDLFTFLLPVFAYTPYPSPKAVRSFLMMFGDLKMSMSLDYAITHLTGLIDQIPLLELSAN